MNAIYIHKRNFIVNFKKRKWFKSYAIRYPFVLIYSFISYILIFFKSRNKRECKYTACICGIFKDEAPFLKEWIDFHLVVGVEHFYLYNNNSTDNYLTVLQPYIDSHIVDLIEWPALHSQMSAYKDCYLRYKDETQWLGYIDIDEFICPKYALDIKEWLKHYIKYPGVLMYWKQFGTSGKLVHDYNLPVIEQYTSCWPKFSVATKLFINTDFNFDKFGSPHFINARMGIFTIPPVNEYKKFFCFGVHRLNWKNSYTIQLNHYWCKAYDIFLKNKVYRTDVYHADNQKMSDIRLNLLKPFDAECLAKDYVIFRFLLELKMKSDNSFCPL